LPIFYSKPEKRGGGKVKKIVATLISSPISLLSPVRGGWAKEEKGGERPTRSSSLLFCKRRGKGGCIGKERKGKKCMCLIYNLLPTRVRSSEQGGERKEKRGEGRRSRRFLLLPSVRGSSLGEGEGREEEGQSQSRVIAEVRHREGGVKGGKKRKK